MLNWYRSGTVLVTNGSANVVGTGTLWGIAVNRGDMFTLDDGLSFYEVAAVTDNTHITLDRTYTGTTLSGQTYAIVRIFGATDMSKAAAQVVQLMTSWQARDDEFTAWCAGTTNGGPNNDGRYPVTDALGNVHLLYSPAYLSGTYAQAAADLVTLNGYRAEALASKNAAEAAQTAVAASASTATTKASEAATSATNAAASASSALSSKNTVTTLAAQVSDDAADVAAALPSFAAAVQAASDADAAATVATTKAAEASDSAADAAASAEAVAQGGLFVATSTTSLAVGTGAKVFTLAQSARAFAVGLKLKATQTDNTANWMEGTVTAYSGNSLTVEVATTGGSGTVANWTLGFAAASAAEGVSTNTANMLVKRDASGNFAAGTITAALNGTASGNVPISERLTARQLLLLTLMVAPATPAYASGVLTSVSYETGHKETYDYSSGRLTGVNYYGTDGTTLLYTLTLGYDGSGNINSWDWS